MGKVGGAGRNRGGELGFAVALQTAAVQSNAAALQQLQLVRGMLAWRTP